MMDSVEWFKVLFPVLTFIVLYYSFYFLQKQFVKRLKNSSLSSNFLTNTVIEVLSKVKKISLCVFALGIALLTIEIPAHLQVIVQRSFKVIILIHIGHFSVLILKLWLKDQLIGQNSEDQSKVTTINLIGLLSQCIIYSLVFLLILNNLGVDITALVAGLGVGGIAIALAIQNILSDLFSSLTIILDKPFIVGDFIVVGEFSGSVEKIGLKTTRLKSLTGEHLVIGNSDLLQSRIRNYKVMNERRILQNLTVVYHTPYEALSKIPLWIKEIISQNPDARFERCHLLHFLDSSLNFELVYWINGSDYTMYVNTSEKINLGILKKFAEEKVEFAYPTRTIISGK